MRKAKSGDKVKIHVTGKLEDGLVFADSSKGEPLQFEIGKSKVIRGVQNAVVGMEPKQRKVIKVPPEKGFGPYQEDLVREVNRELLPEDVNFEKGKTVKLPQANGKVDEVKILNVSDSTVTLDLNHPLAGKDLVLDIWLLEIL